MSVIYFYCAQPKCPKPAVFLIPFGKDLMAACEGCFQVFERSFPQAAGQAEPTQAGDRLPVGYEPIIQQKKVYTKQPSTDKYYSVGRVVGGKKK